MIIKIALGVSIAFNIFLGWYIYKLLRNMLTIEDSFVEFRAKLIEFATHLRAVNTVESFYGDPTITALVQHMKRLAGDIEEYSKVLIIFEDDMEETENDEENEEA